MKIDEEKFGMLCNGKKVKLFTLSAGDIKLSMINYGATWTSLVIPSRKGHKDDVLLGYSGLDGYLSDTKFFGVTVGRFANRIGGASFSLNGKTYHLNANDNNNNLHSGWRGFDKQIWKAETYKEDDGVYVRFELDSPDGDCGFPGNIKAVVSYGLTKSHELIADYQAHVDLPCPVSLTNHSYFNLAGEGKGTVLSHEVTIHSSAYVEVDDTCIPTGKLNPVKDTDFDFLANREICCGALEKFTGYDHCFVVDGQPGKLRNCADVYEPGSGRSMRIFTTQPGVQFYTGNFLNGSAGKQGSRYVKHSGFCLETQHFPDTPNQSEFPPCIFGPDNDYHEKTVFSFGF